MFACPEVFLRGVPQGALFSPFSQDFGLFYFTIFSKSPGLPHFFVSHYCKNYGEIFTISFPKIKAKQVRQLSAQKFSALQYSFDHDKPLIFLLGRAQSTYLVFSSPSLHVRSSNKLLRHHIFRIL
jgi:hypothetical protein